MRMDTATATATATAIRLHLHQERLRVFYDSQHLSVPSRMDDTLLDVMEHLSYPSLDDADPVLHSGPPLSVRIYECVDSLMRNEMPILAQRLLRSASLSQYDPSDVAKKHKPVQRVRQPSKPVRRASSVKDRKAVQRRSITSAKDGKAVRRVSAATEKVRRRAVPIPTKAFSKCDRLTCHETVLPESDCESS